MFHSFSCFLSPWKKYNVCFFLWTLPISVWFFPFCWFMGPNKCCSGGTWRRWKTGETPAPLGLAFTRGRGWKPGNPLSLLSRFSSLASSWFLFHIMKSEDSIRRFLLQSFLISLQRICFASSFRKRRSIEAELLWASLSSSSAPQVCSTLLTVAGADHDSGSLSFGEVLHRPLGLCFRLVGERSQSRWRPALFLFYYC